MSTEQIQVSDAAVAKVRQLMADEDNEYLKLRVFVTGGGCAGFQYGFTFDEEAAEDDAVVDREGVQFLIDPLSFQYLQGSVVNYSEGLQGARFQIENPSATTTCGCGSSFGI